MAVTVTDGVSILPTDEDEILRWFHPAVVRVTENRIPQSRLGTLDERHLLQSGAMGPLFRHPYFKSGWPERRSDHSADFVEFVDRELVPLEGLTPEGPTPEE